MATNAHVVLDDRLPLEAALTALKKEMLKRGTFKDMRRHDQHIKPSQMKRMKSEAARKKIRKGAAARARKERLDET